MIKIALVGTHNTGKTTLFKLMQKDKVFEDYLFIPEQIRVLHDQGYGINENADDITQLALALENQYYGMLEKNTFTRQGIVFDRCILDNYIYALYLNKKGIISNKVLNTIKTSLDRTLPELQWIFWLRPEFSLDNDGKRSTNKQFQTDIDLLFKEFFESHKGKYYYRELKGESKFKLEAIKEIITGGYVY